MQIKKKTTKTSPNDKKERRWNKREKEQAAQGKITVQLEEINQ